LYSTDFQSAGGRDEESRNRVFHQSKNPGRKLPEEETEGALAKKLLK